MRRSPNAIFFEVQYLRQQRLMIVLVPAALFMIGFFAYAMVRQLIHGKPFGDDPMSDRALAIMGPFYILLGLAMLWLYFKSRLVTEVRPDGLFVRFYPFHRRFQHIQAADIENCEVRVYRAIRDYGGWGIRRGVKGAAYNVMGNRGAYLVLKNGRKLLVGSQKAQMLVDAIASIR